MAQTTLVVGNDVPDSLKDEFSSTALFVDADFVAKGVIIPDTIRMVLTYHSITGPDGMALDGWALPLYHHPRVVDSLALLGELLKSYREIEPLEAPAVMRRRRK